MSLTGRNTLSLRKKDVLEQKQAGSAYKRLVFAHKATAAGQTGINITSLTQPSEMAALGFTNPSTAELQAAKMLFYKKNLTVVSSIRGLLIQDLSYTIATNERIAFQGFTSDENEIFTCTLESSVKDGLQVVDAIAITSTGDLAIAATDYNVGVPFQVGKNISMQMGSVLVFREGIIQARNPNNGTSGGNYQEIDAGGGLGNIIRFNTAPIISAEGIIVVSNGSVAERPTGSLMAVVESLAGQMDLVIPTVAALAGQPETNYQGAPNNVDLKSFGDKVAALLTAQVPIVTEWIAYTPVFTGFGTVTVFNFQWRRDGQDLLVKGEFTSGASTAVEARISIPFTSSSSLPSLCICGSATTSLASVGGLNPFIEPSVSYITMGEDPGAFISKSLGSSLISTGNTATFDVRIPISGWTATQTLAQQLGL